MADVLICRPDGSLVPARRWQLQLPPDASLADVIELINRLPIIFTGADEAELFAKFGPAALYFRRLP